MINIELPIEFKGKVNKKSIVKTLFVTTNQNTTKDIYTIYWFDKDQKIFVKVQPSMYPSNMWPIQVEYIRNTFMAQWIDPKEAFAKAKEMVDLFFMASKQAQDDWHAPFNFSITTFKPRENPNPTN